MKNFILLVNVCVLATLLITGCDINEPRANPPIISEYSIINGDTVKTVVNEEYKKIHSFDPDSKNYIAVGDTILLYQEPKLHTPPADAPELGNIKNNTDPDLKDKPLRYVAIGGSLTAGVRDGGYFNEGILTSYPNLIARQMRLEKFEQPLFDNTNYNGFGRKVVTSFNPTGGSIPKFNIVKNNIGVEYIDEKNISFNKYIGKPDNYAIPEMSIGLLSPYTQIKDIDFLNNLKIHKELVKRITPDERTIFVENILNQKFDFFTYEMGWADIWDYVKSKVGPIGKSSILPNSNAIFEKIDKGNYQYASIDNQTKFIKALEEKKVKYGCFLNMPNILDFPYFKFVNPSLIDNVVNQYSKEGLLVKTSLSGGGLGRTITQYELFLPKTDIDSLVSIKIQPTLKKGINLGRPIDYLSFLGFNAEIRNINELINGYNAQTANFAKYCGYPVVDLNRIYNRILKGEYITDDGIKVDGNYSTGNFFSSDGIYPTAFGQAVIANEIIKAINTNYKTKISLIKTAEYLKKQ